MSRTPIIVIAAILLILLIWFCVRTHGPAIEADLTTRSSNFLSKNTMATADGRDVTLIGTVATQALKDKAGSQAIHVWGVRKVINDIVVMASATTRDTSGTAATPAAEGPPPNVVAIPATPYEMLIRLQDNRLVVGGSVPDEQSRTALLAAARAAHPGREIVDATNIRKLAPSGWLLTVHHAITILTNLKDGVVQLRDDTILVRGRLSSNTSADAFRSAFRDGIDAKFTARFNLMTPDSVAQQTKVAEPAIALTAALVCQRHFNELLASQTIDFESNEAIIKRRSFELLDQLSEIADTCPDTRVLIAGHTDTSGDDAYNKALSRRRAEAVVAYLIDKGISSARLTAKGFGEERPIADNETAAGKAKNRRVEFVVQGA